MKDRINSLVKFREEFRPFAPSILDEFGNEYFENYQTSPYMERTLTFRESARKKVPAIVHVNRTGRLQWHPSQAIAVVPAATFARRACSQSGH